MIKDLLFSLNVSLPIFLVLLVGWWLMKKRVLDESFFSHANLLVFHIALPAKLFLDTASSDLMGSLDFRFLSLAAGGTAIAFIGAWVLGAFVMKEPAKIGAFAHGAFRGNYVYMGFAILQNILGTEVVPASASVVAAFVLPLYNIFAVVLLSVTNHPGKKINFKSIFGNIIRNPMILAIFIGLPFSLFHISLPFAITKSLSYLGAVSTPLALLIIGSTIQISLIRKNLKPILLACFYKLVLLPAIVIPLAVYMGFSSEQVLVLFVLFAVPSAANVYIVTKTMGGDAELGSGIIVTSVLCSIITLTLGIFALKKFGIL